MLHCPPPQKKYDQICATSGKVCTEPCFTLISTRKVALSLKNVMTSSTASCFRDQSAEQEVASRARRRKSIDSYFPSRSMKRGEGPTRTSEPPHKVKQYSLVRLGEHDTFPREIDDDALATTSCVDTGTSLAAVNCR